MKDATRGAIRAPAAPRCRAVDVYALDAANSAADDAARAQRGTARRAFMMSDDYDADAIFDARARDMRRAVEMACHTRRGKESAPKRDARAEKICLLFATDAAPPLCCR